MDGRVRVRVRDYAICDARIETNQIFVRDAIVDVQGMAPKMIENYAF